MFYPYGLDQSVREKVWRGSHSRQALHVGKPEQAEGEACEVTREPYAREHMEKTSHRVLAVYNLYAMALR